MAAADGGAIVSLSAHDVYRSQRTAEGLKYDKARDEMRRRTADPKYRAERDATILRLRTVQPGQVHTNAFMTSFSVQYKNDDYIGEQLMPVATVSKANDNFAIYDKRSRLGETDDRMTSHSDANEIAESRSVGSYVLEDHGLKDFLPGTTVENQDPGFDEMLDLQEGVLEALALNREIRHATVLTTAANFGTTTTLSGVTQWNHASGGAPLSVLQAGIASCWTGKGPGDMVGYCSLDVANVLTRHPQLLDLYKYTTPGLTKLDALARELGLTKILVAASRKDTANSGATASYSRIWGKHFGVVRVARRPSLRNAAFGYTVRMAGHPRAYQWFDQTKGVSGCYFSKVGFSEVEKVVAGDTAWLGIDVIS